MSNPVKRNGYLLTEMLVVIALTAFLFSVLFGFFYKTFRGTTAATEKAWNVQRIDSIKHKWREFIHHAGLRKFKTKEHSLVSDLLYYADTQPGKLILVDRPREETIRLPVNVRAEFSLEPQDSGPPLAVLTLIRKVGKRPAETYRIVASPNAGEDKLP